MARRIQPIFDAILSDARITGSERSFVESRQSHYRARKSLTAGRRRCLLDIEEHLKAAPASIDTAMESRLDSLLSRATEAKDRWAMDFIPSLKGQLLAGRALSPRQVEILAKVEARHSAEAVAEREKTTAPLRGRLQALTARVTEGSWAGGFVESLTEQVASGRNLSPRQIEILEKIESEHSDEAVNAAAAWNNNFSEDMRERLPVVARYYRREGYFSNLVDRVLTLDGQSTTFIPSEKQYRKITENKYAQKVLKAHFDAPKYPAGSMVQLRPYASYTALQKVGDRPCVVISTTEPIVSAAKGAKMYRVLPFGSTDLIFVEERHIKKARGV